MARIMTIHERKMVLREWERRGWIVVNKNVKLDIERDIRLRWTTYIVPGVDEFRDDGAEELGASPSELLIAQIALALASQGKML